MERKRRWLVERGDVCIKEKEEEIKDLERMDGNEFVSSCFSLFVAKQCRINSQVPARSTNNFPLQDCNLVWGICAVKINQTWLNAS